MRFIPKKPNWNIFNKEGSLCFRHNKENENVTQKQLSLRTGLSLSSIKIILKNSSENKYIERIGGT
mgnify:CR=1 FL=1